MPTEKVHLAQRPSGDPPCGSQTSDGACEFVVSRRIKKRTGWVNVFVGGANGTTNEDRTNYFESLPSGSLEFGCGWRLTGWRLFFKTYYTPNNLLLAITGDFQITEAKRLVEKYYGPIPAGPALDRPKLWVAALNGEKVIEVKDHVPQERTVLRGRVRLTLLPAMRISILPH